MPIISVEIIENINEREMKKKQQKKQKQKKTERSKGKRSYNERLGAKWFCCAFKLF